MQTNTHVFSAIFSFSSAAVGFWFQILPNWADKVLRASFA
jgi:hypothetical protein